MKCVAILFLTNFFLVLGSSVNYCGSKMCDHTNAHTFCQFPVGPGLECMGYIDGWLSDEEKVRIIARLNRRRSEAALGRLRRLPTAGNMLKLRWVEDLAREAQRWADQCRPPRTPEENDACRDLYSISVGQCVATVVGEAPGLLVESMIDMWYTQSMLYKGNVTSYVPPPNNSSYYGDFAQIIWAQTYMVGCGRSRFMIPWYGRLRSIERLVCNFAPRGPIFGRALWTPASPTTACPPRSRPDSELTALCNFQPDLDESDDIENVMLLEDHLLLNVMFDIERNDSLNYPSSLDQFYLTKLAIATLENVIPTPSYINSVQKRDILPKSENLHIENEFIPHIEITQNENDTQNESIQQKEIKLHVFKKKNLIGRPKPYDLTDLNDVETHLKNEYEHDLPSLDMPQKEKDFYLDYQFLEVQDQNISTVLIPSSVSVVDESTETGKGSIELTSGSTEEITAHATSEAVVNNQTVIDMQNANLTRNLQCVDRSFNSSELCNTNGSQNSNGIEVKTMDDYLSDPETVQELQEALDRMEHALESSSPASGKVRRELRELPPDSNQGIRNDDDITITSTVYYESVPTVETSLGPDEVNKTLNRTPMLNMVLRYMPYLKQYENEILGTAVSKSINTVVSSPIIIFITTVFVV